MPASPSNSGIATNSHAVLSTVASGVTMMQLSMPEVVVWVSAMGSELLLFLRLLPLSFSLLDDTDVHEGVLGEVVPFAIADFFEAANRLSNRRDFASFSGEHFRHQERLREEPLEPACTQHDELIFFRQFINAEDGDDVLKFPVALEDCLHSAGTFEVPLSDVLWIENAAVRRQRIDRRINTFF